MHTRVFLALLFSLSVSQAQTTLTFQRNGDQLTVSQGGTSSTVAVSSNNDFIVPVPGGAPAGISPSPVVMPMVAPTVQAASRPTSNPSIAVSTSSVLVKHKHRIKPAADSTALVPSSVLDSPSFAGGGVIITPSELPGVSTPLLPAVSITGADSHIPGTLNPPLLATQKSPSPTIDPSILSTKERTELNLYRSLLAHPLRITVENSQVDVKWDTVSGSVAIPPSRQIDIRLDRVAKPPKS